jgi:hypothetical protein
MDPDQTAQMRRLVWIHAGRKRAMLVLSYIASSKSESSFKKTFSVFLQNFNEYFPDTLVLQTFHFKHFTQQQLLNYRSLENHYA